MPDLENHKVVGVAAGFDHSAAWTGLIRFCALAKRPASGDLFTWGYAHEGQLGLDEIAIAFEKPRHVKLLKGTKIVKVVLSGDVSFALSGLFECSLLRADRFLQIAENCSVVETIRTSRLDSIRSLTPALRFRLLLNLCRFHVSALARFR